MTESTSLIDLGSLSKPATVLVEKISDAVGGIFKPWQIKRVAEAEAHAARVAAETQIQTSELERRALRRFVTEEARKQHNIEAITAGALPGLEDSASPSAVEDDWLANFFDKCRLVSDTEMQNLWSRVLSGEANRPGAFSKRVVNFLSSIDKSDATLFEGLCRVSQPAPRSLPLVYSHADEIYRNCGITFASLTHLESIGLIKFENNSEFMLRDQSQYIDLLIGRSQFRVELPGPKRNVFMIGQVMLTQLGHELARLCKSDPVEGFDDYLVQQWNKRGYVVSMPLAYSKEGA